MHAVLEYLYDDNYLQTREKYRSVHLKAAWEAVERGELLMGGAVGDGPFTGLLIFTGENPLEAAKAFAAALLRHQRRSDVVDCQPVDHGVR